MRIALVSPLFESVPPRLYGGTERVVAYLEEALVALGHEVTVYASGDSRTHGRLRAPCRVALRMNRCLLDVPHHVLELEMVAAEADRFDIIHFHLDYLHFPLARRLRTPSLTTLHGRLDLPDAHPLFLEFADLPFVSISDNQRTPLPFLNWVGTIHHGLPKDLLRLEPRPDEYLAFLGRISQEKRVDRAIEIARRTGRKLKVAAKVDPLDATYFETVKDLLREDHVEFVGEISEAEKQEFLGKAAALLFPIDWPEPFGLVMIEAMATGTPVIAYPAGSVPELIQTGQNGFVVSSVEEAELAVRSLGRIDRRACRAQFESRFTAERMAADHVRIYEEVRAGPIRLLPTAGEIP